MTRYAHISIALPVYNEVNYLSEASNGFTDIEGAICDKMVANKSIASTGGVLGETSAQLFRFMPIMVCRLVPPDAGTIGTS